MKPTATFREVLQTIMALPLFAVTPLLRPWHTRWGATREEATSAMPGDEYFPRAQFQATRAISIDAPPCDVYPWLLQVGLAGPVSTATICSILSAVRAPSA